MNQFFYQSNSIDKSQKLMKTKLLNWFSDCSLEVVAQNRASKNEANSMASFWAMLSLLSMTNVQNRLAVVGRTFVSLFIVTILVSFKAVAAQPDLSVSTTISNQSPAIGTDVTYTVKINNINPDKATGVELTNILPEGVTFKSFNINGVGTATTSTNAGVTSVVWNVGEVAGSSELTMTIVATVTKRGFWYNIAEITKETEQDADSTPNNKAILEDDEDATCFSLEEYFYDGDEYTTNLPTGFTNIVWTKKVGITGTPTIVTSATTGVTLLPDGNIRVTSVNDYTEYAFTATNGRCPVNGCCAFKFTPGLFGSIGSVVWNDVDGNSIRNTNENGINGIRVELYDASDNTLLATDTTADGGKYLFSNLMSGSYRVKFILPSGRTFVTQNVAGSNVNNDSDAANDGFSGTILIDVSKPVGDVGRENTTIGAGIVSNCIITTGTLVAANDSLCLPAAGGTVVLSATTGVSPTVPVNYSVRYILTQGTTNTIQQNSTSPSFTVGLAGDYKIFTLVYDANPANPNYLDLSTIIPGVTRISDLETTINSSGKCALVGASGLGFLVRTTLAAPFVLGTTVCAGGTVTIGTPGVTNPIFQWFTSAESTTPFATTSSITVSPTSTTTYFLSLVSTTGSACPSEKSSVEIAVTPKPTRPVVLAGIANNCAINASTVNLADAITSTVSPGGTFEWHVGSSSSSAIVSNTTAATAGTYFLFERSSNGCYSDGAGVVVTINSCQCANPPVASLTALAPICGGVASPVQLNAILSGGATSGVWTTNGTGTFDNSTSTTARYTPSAADMVDGSIVLTFTTNDPDGTLPVCNAAVPNVILTIRAKPAAPVNLRSDTLICLGNSTRLFAVSAGNTIRWYSSATSTTPIGTGSDSGFIITPTTEGTFTYFAEATSADGCVSDRSAISFVVKKCVTDIAVVKSVITSPNASTAPSYLLGQEIAYTIDARNIGTIDAANVTVTDLLPQGATFVSALPSSQYNSTTGVWNVGSLSEGSNKILLINVRLTRTGSIANTATITSTDDDTTKLANNTSTVTVNVVASADLSLVKTVSNLSPNVGDTLTYTLTLRNDGPNTATNIEIKDIIPNGLAFISSTNTTHTSGIITGTVGSLTSGSTQVFTYRVRVVSAGTFTSAAEVTKSDQPDPDSTPANGTNNNEDDKSTISIIATEPCNLLAPVVTITNSTICLSGQTTLTATGCTRSTIVWSTGETNVASITVSPTSTRTYSASCLRNTCQSPTSNIITVNVTNVAAPNLVASVGTICAGESSVLTATGCTGTVEWQVAGLPTGNTLTVTPTSSQTFTAKCKASSCESVVASINVIVTQKPAAPQILAEKTEICPSESITLTAINCNGSVRWNTGQTTTSILVTPLVETSYTATCTVNGCISNVSTARVISVVPISAPTITTNGSTICPGGTATLSASGCAGVVTWYFDDRTATGASLTVSPTRSTSYAVTCTTAFCTSVRSQQVVITVENPAIPVVTSSASTMCFGSSVQLTATGCAGTVNWSDGQRGAVVTVSPATTTSYTATCTIGACTSAASLNRTITVTQTSSPTITADKTTVCLGQSITLTASGCAGTIRWSDGSTNTPKVILPTANVRFTAVCEVASCASPVSNELSFTVNTVPAINTAPVTTNIMIAAGATADLTRLVTSTTPAGTILVFKTTSSPTTNTVLNPNAVSVGTYFAFYQTTEGCYSAGTRIIVDNGSATLNADVAIQIEADRTTAAINQNISFLISASNNGPGVARNIVITNPLPAGLTFVSSSTGLTISGGQIVINLDSLERGQIREFAYVARMNVASTVVNPVSVSSFRDSNLANNSSSVTINPETIGVDCKVGLAMSVADTSIVRPGLYNVTYRLIARNFCSDTLKNINLTTNLGSTFKSPVTMTFTQNPRLGAGSRLVLNSGFGLLDSNLVNNVNSIMLPNAIDTITYIVQVSTQGRTGPYNSQAFINGKRPNNEILTAKSSDGTNVNGTPSVTKVPLGPSSTRIGVAKELVSSGLRRQGNVWTVPYRIRVVNMGAFNITRLSVRDSLSTAFIAKGAVLVGNPIVTSTKAGIVINPNYSGVGANANLLVESASTLATADTAIINLTINLNVSAATDSIFNNLAIATGQGSNGIAFTDISTNGVNPDGNGDLNPSNDSTATPVILGKTIVDCKVGLAMSVMDTSIVRSGVYNVTYRLIAKNFCSDTLKNIDLTSNLASTFKSPVTVIFIQRPTLGLGSRLILNNAYSLLDSNLVNSASSMMLPNAVDTITYIVQVETRGNTGPFNSQAHIKGTRPNSAVLEAESSDGTNVNGVPSVTKVPLGPPSTMIGLAKELVSTGLRRDSVNVWTIPYRLRVVNMGAFAINKLSIKDSLDGVFTFKGASIVGKPLVTTTKAGITINPNYTGKGLNTNLLIDSLSTLARGDSAIINLTVKVNVAAATDSVFNNVAIAIGLGADNKLHTDVSTNGISPDVDKDLNPNNDNVATPVIIKKESGVSSQAAIGLALAAVTDTIAQSDGSYNVKLTLVAKNYSPVPLSNILLSNDLEKTIGRQVGAWTLLGRPTLVRGLNASLNTTFNGRIDTLLTDAPTSALAAGDSIVIEYTVNVTNPLIDTLFTFAHAKATTQESIPVNVTDTSVNGSNPDPNNDGKPLELSPTPMIFPKKITKVSIPHGFSPNGDGVNDTFVIDGVNPDERANLEVYNRWGSLVYASLDYKNDWNGMPNTGARLIEVGEGLPSGTYFYVVTIYKRATGEKVEMPTTVEPIRYMTISR